MTTFKIIDHDCETDPAAVATKECKVDAPTSAHALAEYLGVTTEEIFEGSALIAQIVANDPDAELWRVERHPLTDNTLREVGAVRYERD